MPINAIVLAATRMKSAHPKVVHKLLGKPLVWWTVDAARKAGVDRIIVVVGNGADEVRAVFADDADVECVEQTERLGTGHAVRCAAEKTGDEPFYVLLGDVLVPNNKMLPRMQEISDAHGGASVIAVMPVPHEEVKRFGVIAGEELSADVWKIDSLVEKPAPEDAPSNLAVFGRYLLSPRVMELLEDAKPTVGGEIQLTDALDAVLKEEEMYALVIDPADGFDTGTVESWLETNNILWERRNA